LDNQQKTTIYDGGILRDYTLAIIHNENLGSYLAGLIEGDRHFDVRLGERRKFNRKHNPQIVITFDRKNLP
jgi:hypothetical protein